jgi:type I restriction enzyme R subunit
MEAFRLDVNTSRSDRPHRRYVEEFQARPRWNHLSTGDAVDIETHLAPMPTPDEDDEFARRFDLLLLNLQLAILECSPDQARYQERVCDLVGGLEEKKTIPSVSQQMELILEVQTDSFWQNVTLPMLEQARRQLRDLIKFIDRGGGREKVYTQFEDTVGEGQEVYGLITKDPKLKNYHLKMQKFIRDHEAHITIQRLKNNQPISHTDLSRWRPSCSPRTAQERGTTTRPRTARTGRWASWYAASWDSTRGRPKRRLRTSWKRCRCRAIRSSSSA